MTKKRSKKRNRKQLTVHTDGKTLLIIRYKNANGVYRKSTIGPFAAGIYDTKIKFTMGTHRLTFLDKL